MAKNGHGIVDWYAQMWPREIFDRGAVEARRFPFLKEPGVYVLYNNERPYYIGKANSMMGRLHDHAKPNSQYFNFWNLFSAFAIGDAKGRDELEAILIASMPTANSSKPKLNKRRLPKEVMGLMKKIRDSKLKGF